MAKGKVCHITTVHEDRYDTRIFKRECVSLVEKGYDVFLFVADGKGNERIKGVEIVDLGQQKKSRLFRVFNSNKILRNKLPIDEIKLYHFHDPELIPFFFFLKRKHPSLKIVFDIHENFKDKIEGGRDWLPSFLRSFLKSIFVSLERISKANFDGFVGAVDRIIEGFPEDKSITLRNFPDLQFFKGYKKRSKELRKRSLVYTGGFTAHRGIEQIIEAMSLLQQEIELTVFGAKEDHILERCQKKAAWKMVKYVGRVNQSEMLRVVHNSEVALVLNQPEGGYQYALPNKLFEYMACSVPVICSDFPHWKKVVELNNSGLCVDSSKPEMIAKAIENLLENWTHSSAMGEQGRKVIEKEYNWKNEFNKLDKLYQKILND